MGVEHRSVMGLFSTFEKRNRFSEFPTTYTAGFNLSMNYDSGATEPMSQDIRDDTLCNSWLVA